MKCVQHYHRFQPNKKTTMPRTVGVAPASRGQGSRRRRSRLNISVIEDLSEDTGKTLHTKDGQVLLPIGQ